jgi:aminomethyltransferase
MTHLAAVHDDHGATFLERGGRRFVGHYGNPERVHRAVRTVVGVIEYGYGIVSIEGSDREDVLDRTIPNRLPREDGNGVYTLSLSPEGDIETDLYAFNAGNRLLVFTPPGQAQRVAEAWRGRSEGDATIDVATDDFATFGVHGPQATEKIASVFSEAAPDERLAFVRGSMDKTGVTVVRTDAPAGEEGYDVICAADAARDVFDTLENRGLNAAPFGYWTWQSLTLEAGTPLFETELAGRKPINLGLPAVDTKKEESVGRSAHSQTEASEEGKRKLVVLGTESEVAKGDSVRAGGDTVGEVTRGAFSPTRDEPLAFALVAAGANAPFEVRGDELVDARRFDLPVVEGSDRSGRIPSY